MYCILSLTNLGNTGRENPYANDKGNLDPFKVHVEYGKTFTVTTRLVVTAFLWAASRFSLNASILRC